MHGLERGYLALAPRCVDVAMALVIAFYVGKALWAILRGLGSDAAKLIVARGVLAALGFSMAGSLLKMIQLQNLASIRMFGFVFLFRTGLKRVFLREERLAAAREVYVAHAMRRTSSIR